jgi:hypothetical protein
MLAVAVAGHTITLLERLSPKVKAVLVAVAQGGDTIKLPFLFPQ